jgi:YidC/Oxa1 family membrane protein insertase
MKSDKNSLIGFVLLGILFFSYFWYTSQQQTALVAFKKQQEDSIAKVQAKLVKPQDVVAAKIDSLQRDSIAKIATAGNFAEAALGKDTTVTIENELISVVLSNKGGQVKSVTLKKYTISDTAAVKLVQQNQMGYAVNTADNKTALTSDLYFSPSIITKTSDGSSSIQIHIT